MNSQTIADTAIYQQTAQLADKYKAQRDELLIVAKSAVMNIENNYRWQAHSDLQTVVEKVEQSL